MDGNVLNHELISRRMSELGLKNADLARETRSSRACVSKWVLGKSMPSGEPLIKLLNALKLAICADGNLLVYRDVPVINLSEIIEADLPPTSNFYRDTLDQDVAFAVEVDLHNAPFPLGSLMYFRAANKNIKLKNNAYILISDKGKLLFGRLVINGHELLLAADSNLRLIEFQDILYIISKVKFNG